MFNRRANHREWSAVPERDYLWQSIMMLVRTLLAVLALVVFIWTSVTGR